jgi:hypothetical protein
VFYLESSCGFWYLRGAKKSTALRDFLNRQ